MIVDGNIEDFYSGKIRTIDKQRSKFTIYPETVDTEFLWKKKLYVKTGMPGILGKKQLLFLKLFRKSVFGKF